MEECWDAIVKKAEEADVLVVTHYHYDHHDPSAPEIFEGKIALLKHPTEKINRSQRERAAIFLERLGSFPKKVEYVDGREFKFGKTILRASPPVFHGTNPRLGYVTEILIDDGKERFLFTSDVEGPSVDDQIAFILREKPHVLVVDGPMTYMLGFRYSRKSLQLSIENLLKAMDECPLRTLVVDHHFMRDLKFRTRLAPVYEKGERKGVDVLTAAEFMGRKIEQLEALRKKLYEEHPAEARPFEGPSD